jgi:histone H3/H4
MAKTKLTSKSPVSSQKSGGAVEAKRHKTQNTKRSAFTTPSLKRCFGAGGVRKSTNAAQSTLKLLLADRFLPELAYTAGVMARRNKRFTIMGSDVQAALQYMGMPLLLNARLYYNKPKTSAAADAKSKNVTTADEIAAANAAAKSKKVSSSKKSSTPKPVSTEA